MRSVMYWKGMRTTMPYSAQSWVPLIQVELPTPPDYR
jgi:hypothetical protein